MHPSWLLSSLFIKAWASSVETLMPKSPRPCLNSSHSSLLLPLWSNYWKILVRPLTPKADLSPIYFLISANKSSTLHLAWAAIAGLWEASGARWKLNTFLLAYCFVETSTVVLPILSRPNYCYLKLVWWLSTWTSFSAPKSFFSLCLGSDPK